MSLLGSILSCYDILHAEKGNRSQSAQKQGVGGRSASQEDHSSDEHHTTHTTSSHHSLAHSAHSHQSLRYDIMIFYIIQCYNVIKYALH